jgi:hypothetical protein
VFPVPCDLNPEVGYVRIYTDHTGRWYEDIPEAQLEESKSDPLMRLLQEEINKEINREIVRTIVKGASDNAD